MTVGCSIAMTGVAYFAYGMGILSALCLLYRCLTYLLYLRYGGKSTKVGVKEHGMGVAARQEGGAPAWRTGLSA